MNGPTLYDYMESFAKEGHTHSTLNIYPRTERKLLIEGFAVQRLGPVEGYSQQHKCKVNWADAVKGTVAHHFLELAAAVRPELLQQSEESIDGPVPRPYSSGGGWEQP